MNAEDVQYEVEVTPGRVLVYGVALDSHLDHFGRVYRQSAKLSRQQSIELAVAAGRDIERHLSTATRGQLSRGR